jgi:hypothetical protein
LADSELKPSFILISSKEDIFPPGKKPRVRVFEIGDDDDDAATKATKKKATEAEAAVKRVEQAFDSLNQTLETAIGGGGLFGDFMDMASDMGPVLTLMGKGAMGTGLGMKDLSKAIEGGVSAVVGFINVAVKFASKLEDSRVELARTTGYMNAYRKEVQQTTIDNAKLGLSLSEATKNQTALHVGFKMFPTLSRSARTAVAKLTAEFSNLGVDAGETAKAFDLVTLGMGVAAEKSTSVIYKFDEMAQKLGVSTGALVKDFAQIGGDLAKYGPAGEKQFKKLAAAARKAGLDVRQAFDVAMLADTYEGAAELAGKLNAQLGLRINDVELMKATEEERLEIIRQEFMEKRRFDDLSRREKQAISEIFQVDVAVARKLLTGGMDVSALQKEREATDKRAEQSATALKKFNAQLEKLMFTFTPILEALNKFIGGLADSKLLMVLGGLITLKVGGAGAAKLLSKFKGKLPGIGDGTITAGARPQHVSVGGGKVIPLDKGDYTLTTPGGDFHAGTKLFGQNSSKFFEQVKRPVQGANESGYGGLLAMFSKGNPLALAGAAAADLALAENKSKSVFRNLFGAVGAGLGLLGGPFGAALGYQLGSILGNTIYGGMETKPGFGMGDGTITTGGKIIPRPRGEFTATAPDGSAISGSDLMSRTGEQSAQSFAALRRAVKESGTTTSAGPSAAQVYKAQHKATFDAIKSGMQGVTINVQADVNEGTLFKATKKVVEKTVRDGTMPLGIR